MLTRFLTISLLDALAVVTALLINAGQLPASASPARVSDNPVWGVDIQVNPQNTSEFDAQRQLGLAVNPIDPNKVIASYDNYSDQSMQSAVAYSTDSGRTWGGSRLPLLGAEQMIPQFNGGVAYDASGTAYYLTGGTGNQNYGIFVLTTTNGTLNREVPIVIADHSTYRSYPHLSVDPRPQGQNVYAFWLYTDVNTGSFWQGIRMRYSNNKGRTWSSDVLVSDSGNDISFSPSSAVASDGTVYVASQQLMTYTIEVPPRLFLDRSTDGGATWGTDRLITGQPIVPAGVPDFKFRELTLLGNDKCSLIRVYHYPYIAISPTDPNTVYVVWNDGRWDSTFSPCPTGPGKHSDIAFSRTTDGGLSWSAPIRLNDDTMGNGIDQFSPSIGVKDDGTIGVTWYDRRYDAANPYFYDVAYTQSTDSGVTWTPNVKISDTSSDPNAIQDVKLIDDPGYRGDVAFGPDFVLPGWQNAVAAFSWGNFFVDRGALIGAIPTPTRTANTTTTATSTTAPTNTRTATSTAPTRTATSAVATTTPTVCAITFTDVPEGSTFYDFIRCLACRGIISGYADGSFRPGNNITRGQIAKMVSNAAGFSEDPNPQIFEDVDPANTFYTWINRLSRRGYMGGYGCGGPGEPCVAPDNRPYFRPNANATRGQLAKIVSNTAELGGDPSGQFYADVAESHPFYDWVMRLTQLNVMSGYSCGGPGEPCDSENRPYFRPFNDVTRAQASKIVANTFYPNCQTP